MYLRVVEEGLLVVAAATSTTTLPLADEGALVPGLLERQHSSVDETTNTGRGVPLAPVVKLHPRQCAR